MVVGLTHIPHLKISIPGVGSGPDWFSFWSHAFGALLSILGTIKLLMEASQVSASACLSCCVYGMGMIFLYLSSCLHHAAKNDKEATDLLRRLDHIAIYCFIASSYTPYCVICLKPLMGNCLLTLIWGMGLAGSYQKIFYKFSSRWLTIATYSIMGWTSLFMYGPLSEVITPWTMNLLVAGGVLYTVGALIYAMKFPNPHPNVVGFHGLWHIFVLAASVCHYASIASILHPAR